jgi:hypothetical protein
MAVPSSAIVTTGVPRLTSSDDSIARRICRWVSNPIGPAANFFSR